jgi:hypothetical protein
MDILEMQKGLIKYFRYSSITSKSIGQIENICTHLSNQYCPDMYSKNAKYEIFYPLLRYGIIESIGDEKFALSPTCLIESKDFILGVNLPKELMAYLKDHLLFNIHLGLDLYYKNDKIKNIITSNNFILQRFDLSQMLTKLNTLDKIIKNWTLDNSTDTTMYQFFNIYEWGKPTKPNILGVYRKSNMPYSHRVTRYETTSWYLVPERSINIDAFNLAVCWSMIKNNWPLNIHYQKSTNLITVKNKYFPLVLERMIFLNSCMHGKKTLDRTYMISLRHFNRLNQFFHNKIEINE